MSGVEMQTVGAKIDDALAEINRLLEADKAEEAADPAAWQKKQYNPTNEPDPMYDPLAKFEAQLRAVKENNKEWRLDKYEEAHPAPKPTKPETLEAAADDVAAAGGRIDSFNRTIR